MAQKLAESTLNNPEWLPLKPFRRWTKTTPFRRTLKIERKKTQQKAIVQKLDKITLNDADRLRKPFLQKVLAFSL